MTDRTGEEGVIPLQAETVQIDRIRTVRGSVKVSTRTASREHLVDETLVDEHAEVERVDCGRFVDAMPAVRTEGDIIVVPIVEEILVTERRLFLKEEIRIRRTRVERRHTESVILRVQEVDIVQD